MNVFGIHRLSRGGSRGPPENHQERNYDFAFLSVVFVFNWIEKKNQSILCLVEVSGKVKRTSGQRFTEAPAASCAVCCNLLSDVA